MKCLHLMLHRPLLVESLALRKSLGVPRDLHITDINFFDDLLVAGIVAKREWHSLGIHFPKEWTARLWSSSFVWQSFSLNYLYIHAMVLLDSQHAGSTTYKEFIQGVWNRTKLYKCVKWVAMPSPERSKLRIPHVPAWVDFECVWDRFHVFHQAPWVLLLTPPEAGHIYCLPHLISPDITAPLSGHRLTSQLQSTVKI